MRCNASERASPQLDLYRGLVAVKNEAGAARAMGLQELLDARHGDGGTVVSAHGVDGKDGIGRHVSDRLRRAPPGRRRGLEKEAGR